MSLLASSSLSLGRRGGGSLVPAEQDVVWLVGTACCTLVLLGFPTVLKPVQQWAQTVWGRLQLAWLLWPQQQQRQRRRRLEKDATSKTEDTTTADEPISVSGLFIHPVKSLRPVSVAEAVVDARGFVDDRRFMLVTPRELPMWKTAWDADDASHRFLTQRQCPSLATVVAKLATGPNQYSQIQFSSYLLPGDSVTVDKTPSTTTASTTWRAKIWDDIVEVVDMGDEVAAFFLRLVQQDTHLSDELQITSVRLVAQATHDRRSTSPSYTPPSAWSLTQPGQTPAVSLADGFPILIANQASLDELNRRMVAKNKKAIPMDRFRPNIVVRGRAPFEEDNWRVISIGGTIFHVVKGCPRCRQSCTDQENGTVEQEPLTTLAEFRTRASDGVYFAQNALPAVGMEGKTIVVGDVVEVLQSGDPIWDKE